jgi:hypothetical protein
MELFVNSIIDSFSLCTYRGNVEFVGSAGYKCRTLWLAVDWQCFQGCGWREVALLTYW